MARPRASYSCQECGYSSPKWLGRCPGCGEWNSFVEEPEVRSGPAGTGAGAGPAGEPRPLVSVEAGAEMRLCTGYPELDRVLGGGLVPGSVVLVGGEPGIGKSTLLLQVCRSFAAVSAPVLYVSGEESPAQVRLRAERIGCLADGMYVLAETDVGWVEQQVARLHPSLLVIDSIQTMRIPEIGSAPGSVTQVRECSARVLRLSKESGIPAVLVGHVVKSGALSGPKVLEHVVDTVLYFEGERHHSFRAIRAAKNRFGSTNDVGLFEMTDGGLVEISNPSGLFLSERNPGAAGSVVAASLEGTRPLLVEVQALVASSALGMPRRMATGIDYNRLALILAILEKRLGLPLQAHDAYVKLVGGVRLDEPAADLAVALAATSSFKNAPVDPATAVFGEVGLGGEIRSVGRAALRIKEAARLGFTRCLLPRGNAGRAQGAGDIELVPVGDVGEAVEASARSLRSS